MPRHHNDAHHQLSFLQEKKKRLQGRIQELGVGISKEEKTVNHLHHRIKHKQAASQPNWNTHPPLTSPELIKCVIAANLIGLVVTATTDGTHAAGSWHYQGRAVDFGVDWNTTNPSQQQTRLKQLQAWAAKEYPHALEIFGPDSYYIKNGVRYGGAFPGHSDHTHIAL